MTANQSAADRAYNALLEGIAGGRWTGGTWLPEPEVCSDLGLSRTPVREAMRRLVSEGLLTQVPNRGVQIAVLTTNDVIDMTAVRAMAESYAASVAAIRMRPMEIAPLEEAAQRMAREVDVDRPNLDVIEECNSHVHDGIISAARSSYLKTLLDSIRRRPITLRTFAQYTPDELRRSAHQHLDILAAIENRDPEWARASMSTHILSARSSLLRGLDADLPEHPAAADIAASKGTLDVH